MNKLWASAARAMLAAAMGLTCLMAHAQSWSTRPVRTLTPFPAGGPSDVIARAAAEKLFTVLKQPVVVENKPGAGGNIGTAELARATPDGYTWLLTTDTVVTINPHLYRNLGFRTDDLLPVAYATSFSQMLVCNPAAGVRTLADLIKQARGKPMSYASGGPGVPGHLAMELLLNVAGVQMTHVPYKGPAPAMQDVMAGEVPCGFLAGPTVLPQVRAGKLAALAVSSTKRSPLAPEVPTVAEAGYPGYDATFALVLFAPRGTPEPIVKAFHKAFTETLASPELQAKAKATDQEIVASSPAEAAARLAADSSKWAAVVKRINLQLD